MGIADKNKGTAKESRLKIKRRSGNVKDFHGRRQHNENVLEKVSQCSGARDFKYTPDPTSMMALKCFAQNPSFSPSVTPLPPKYTDHSATFQKPIEPSKQVSKANANSEPIKYSFDTHMDQWTQVFFQPLITPSTKCEFEMPYCYSEEYYSKMSSRGFVMQPFASIGEPSTAWNCHLDKWYEKAHLALQYYRQLCEQPTRLPSQTVMIKRSVAQFVAEQCALLGTEDCVETFLDSGLRIGSNIVFHESSKSALFLVTEATNQVKQITPDCSEVQLKTDGSIFTSSWQN